MRKIYQSCHHKIVMHRKHSSGQGGILAAAGQYALKHHVDDLAVDHGNAKKLADGIRELNDSIITLNYQATNMLSVSIKYSNLVSFAKERGILFPDGNTLRLVTHRDISAKDIQFTIDMLNDYVR